MPINSDTHRHNVRLGAHDRQIVGDQQALERGGALLEKKKHEKSVMVDGGQDNIET